MRRVVYATIAVCVLLVLGSSIAHAATPALSVNGPHSPGTKVGSWYKDKLTASLSGKCKNNSNYSFDYTSSSSGTHTYRFYIDDNGNPYVKVDSQSSYTALNNHPCGQDLLDPVLGLIGAVSYTQKATFSGSVDTNAPQTQITSPSGSASTTNSTYTINGSASDAEGNLSTVKAIVNGATGPTASVSGSSYSLSIPLESGSNSIQMIAFDEVGHSATSNTVTITKGTPDNNGGSSGGGSSGTGGSSTGGSSGSTSKNSSSKSSKNSSSNTSADAPIVKFGQQQLLNLDDPYAEQSSSNSSNVQEAASLAGLNNDAYSLLVAGTIVLLGICLYVINRFRPLFTKLDKERSGLRRRVILVLVLPSIIPLLALGFLGYTQLSDIVKSSLSDQLSKAAQTSALKLQREFGMRNVIITKTASDIIQIQNHYKDQIDQLTAKKARCDAIIKANVPSRQFTKITSDDNCLPFLSGIAQVTTTPSAKVVNYVNALNEGAVHANSNLLAQENERVNELLNALRSYFPDILEMDIVDASKEANLLTLLPRADPNQPTTSESHRELLTQASTGNLALVDNSSKTQQLFLTYPIKDSKTTLGGVVVAIDLSNDSFVPNIWKSTPKPYESNKVFFVTTNGDVVTPRSSDKSLIDQADAMADNPIGKVYDLKLGNQTLAVRSAPVPNTNWVVAVGAPASTILAPLAGIQFTAIVAIIAFVLISITLSVWFVSSIASEIDKLFLGAEKFASGDLDYQISLQSHDELQALGETMNKMAIDIKAAQAALVQKDKDFINVATHELRAPMTAIIGYLSMVIEDGMGSVDATARDLVNKAFLGTSRLREIVNDMLDIARLESGHADFKLEPIDIRALTQSVVDMQSVVAQENTLTLVYTPDNLTPKVMADKNKLQIILTNFVSNAIKYNRKGGTITVSHKLDDDHLVIAIQDTGLGIPQEQQAHMFEKFYRVQDKDREAVPGTGLGLHITKRFIEAMGGKVWFESVHGQGTTFYFTVPLADQTSQSPSPYPTLTPAPAALIDPTPTTIIPVSTDTDTNTSSIVPKA